MLKRELFRIVTEVSAAENFEIMYPPEGMGDLSSNVAFHLARKENSEPKTSAEKIIEGLETREEIKKSFSKVEFVAPGFINFHYSKEFLLGRLSEILRPGSKYFYGTRRGKGKVNVEFVSANPTGPLTLGNGRSAAYGEALCRVLEAAGFKANREYFINDAGRQVETLGESVAGKLLELNGREVEYSDDTYRGEYIKKLAEKIKKENLYGGDIEDFGKLKTFARDFAVSEMMGRIKSTLERFGVKYDVWFSELSLHGDAIDGALGRLRDAGFVYEKDGAAWFAGTKFGLADDAVLIKSNGRATYLLADFAYAQNKAGRGFDKNIYILGADHHGDVPRIKAGIKALGLPEEKFEFLVHQLVTLKRGGEAVRMSKRTGEFVALEHLLEEVPSDAIKFFFLLKSLNEHIEFDIDLAKERSSKNPVFYIQYAHARAASVFKKAAEQNINIKELDGVDSAGLGAEHELKLVKEMVKLPDIIGDAAANYNIHSLAHWLLGFAGAFHRFYDSSPVLSAEPQLRDARLALVLAAKTAIARALYLLNISVPEKM